MPARSLDHPEWKVHCSATSRSGAPCKKWAIRGGSVCEMHGGATPQVKDAAARRIEEARASVVNLLPEATVRLREILRSSNHNVAIRAVKEVFDRSGLAVQTQHELVIGATGENVDIDQQIEYMLAQRAQRAPVAPILAGPPELRLVVNDDEDWPVYEDPLAPAPDLEVRDDLWPSSFRESLFP